MEPKAREDGRKALEDRKPEEKHTPLKGILKLQKHVTIKTKPSISNEYAAGQELEKEDRFRVGRRRPERANLHKSFNLDTIEEMQELRYKGDSSTSDKKMPKLSKQGQSFTCLPTETKEDESDKQRTEKGTSKDRRRKLLSDQLSPDRKSKKCPRLYYSKNSGKRERKAEELGSTSMVIPKHSRISDLLKDIHLKAPESSREKKRNIRFSFVLDIPKNSDDRAGYTERSACKKSSPLASDRSLRHLKTVKLPANEAKQESTQLNSALRGNLTMLKQKLSSAVYNKIVKPKAPSTNISTQDLLEKMKTKSFTAAKK